MGADGRSTGSSSTTSELSRGYLVLQPAANSLHRSDTLWLDLRTVLRMLGKYDSSEDYFGSSLLPLPEHELTPLQSAPRPKPRASSSSLGAWRLAAQG